MKKEHSKTIVIVVGVALAALLIGLIAAFISIRSVGQQNAAIQSELTRAVSRISQQVQDIKEANEKQYSDKKFNEAVARSEERRVGKESKNRTRTKESKGRRNR